MHITNISFLNFLTPASAPFPPTTTLPPSRLQEKHPYLTRLAVPFPCPANRFTQKRLDDALKRAQKKIESAFKDLDWDLLVHTRRKAKWGAKQDKFARKREEKRARYELAELDQFADIPMEEEEGEESDVWSTLEKGSTKEEGKNQGKGGRDDDKATF